MIEGAIAHDRKAKLRFAETLPFNESHLRIPQGDMKPIVKKPAQSRKRFFRMHKQIGGFGPRHLLLCFGQKPDTIVKPSPWPKTALKKGMFAAAIIKCDRFQGFSIVQRIICGVPTGVAFKYENLKMSAEGIFGAPWTGRNKSRRNL